MSEFNLRGRMVLYAELVYKTRPLFFRLKLVYSYVIEVADSENQLYLHHKFRRYYYFITFWNMHEVDQDVVVMYTLAKIFLFKLFSNFFLTFLGLLCS